MNLFKNFETNEIFEIPRSDIHQNFSLESGETLLESHYQTFVIARVFLDLLKGSCIFMFSNFWFSGQRNILAFHGGTFTQKQK